MVIKGTPEEIKKLFDAIGGSNEQLVTRKELQETLRHYVTWQS